MAKVKTITKKLKTTDEAVFTPEDKGVGYSYKIYASANGNTINDASGKDYLYGGDGNDILIAGAGDDTLSGGNGTNTLTISGSSAGKDTLVLGKGTDHLTFDQSNKFEYSKSGNDLIISHKVGNADNGDVTVRNYFKYSEGKASLKDLNGADLNTLINTAGLTLTNVTSKNKKIAGTYLSDVIVAQGKTNNTITTGKGNDTITAGLGKDTITIDGAGTKIIKINKGDGNDTIAFKGDGVNATVKLVFDENAGADFADKFLYSKSGNNLLITREWEESATKTMREVTTIKDYFKYEPAISVQENGTDELTALNVVFSDNNFKFDVAGNAKKANKLNGTNYNDVITGGNKADKITTGAGVDVITAGKGNDTITINGTGNKTINIGKNDGKDTIAFDLDKVSVDTPIKVDVVFTDGGEEAPEFSIALNQADLLITNVYDKVTQTTTIKNFFANIEKVSLYINGDNAADAIDALKSAPTNVGTTYKGTPFDDAITGSAKADTIYGYAGDDVITASKGNDKIYGGDGDDTYVYTNFAGKWDDDKYYTDTIYNSNGDDRISFTDLASSSAYFQTQPLLQGTGLFPGFDNLYGCTYIKQGNDLVIGAFESEDPYNRNFPMNRITLKDYFKSEKGEYGVKIIDNGVGNDDYASINLADDMMIEHSWRTISALSDHKSNKYTGTAYNDYIEGSYKQDVLYGGDGNDIVNGFNCVKGKDYLYGGAGNDILGSNDAYMYGGTGNDTYMSASQDTYRGVSTVISDESGYDTVALPIGKYLIYFDVTQEKGVVKSTGDIYIKDNTLERIPTIGIGNVYATAAGDEDSYTVPVYGGSDRVIKGRIGTLKDSEGTVIKNGTTTGIIENFEMGAYEGTVQHIRYSASYDQTRIDTTANLVAQTLNEYGFGSLQEAIKNGTKGQLGALLDIYEANMLKWTTVIYNEDNTYYYQNTNNSHYNMSDYLPIGDILETYNGTMYSCDPNTTKATIYNYTLNEDARYSVINDYGGKNDILNLYYSDKGFSFLFDVEVDGEGNLLNYSRDFYVKFAGDEAKETGIVIHDGRQESHAIEYIYMKHDTTESNAHDLIFAYNQAEIDATRAEVANWLHTYNDGQFGSVQDVLHSGNETAVEAMMAVFNEMDRGIS